MLFDLLVPLGLCVSTYSCLTSGHSTIEHFNRWKNNRYSSDEDHRRWLLSLAGFATFGVAMSAIRPSK
jgi:hypothetical protein